MCLSNEITFQAETRKRSFYIPSFLTLQIIHSLKSIFKPLNLSTSFVISSILSATQSSNILKLKPAKVQNVFHLKIIRCRAQYNPKITRNVKGKIWPHDVNLTSHLKLAERLPIDQWNSIVSRLRIDHGKLSTIKNLYIDC